MFEMVEERFVEEREGVGDVIWGGRIDVHVDSV